MMEFRFLHPVCSEHVDEYFVVWCDLATSSLYWFVDHFVSFEVAVVSFHVCPPWLIPTDVDLECEVSVVRVSVFRIL